MYPHRIRLRGPWEFEPLAATRIDATGRIIETGARLPAAGRIMLPVPPRGSTLDGFRGRVRWRRSFHAPRTLEPHERLWLVVDAADYFAQARLDGAPLGRHEGCFEPFEFEITPLVRRRNELALELDCPREADPARKRMLRGTRETLALDWSGGLGRGAALEVRSVAFLRGVSIRTRLDGAGRVTVWGQVVGEPGMRLTLELTLAGEALATHAVEAAPEGVPFRIESARASVRSWRAAGSGEAAVYPLRVELYGMAETLDVVERSVGFRAPRFDPALAAVIGDAGPVPALVRDIDALEFREGPEAAVAQIGAAAAAHAGHAVIASLGARAADAPIYALADRAGVLLQQDMPLAGGYATLPALRDEAVRQACAMVAQLGHHPSIIAWCCHADSCGENDELDQAVRAAVTDLDPTRPCLVR
jgi:beta-mannosidase